MNLHFKQAIYIFTSNLQETKQKIDKIFTALDDIYINYRKETTGVYMQQSRSKLSFSTAVASIVSKAKSPSELLR